MKRALPFVIIAAVLAAAVVGVWYLTRTPEAPLNPGANNPVAINPAATNSPASNTPNAPVSNSDVDPGAAPPHFVGDANAKVVLEEFGDFQCPPCAALHPILKTMEEEFGPRLKVIFREYPLSGHQHAATAARAAEAAAMQGKFWEMHGILYENQNAWSQAFDARPIFEGYAKKIGLNVDKWKTDMASDAVERRIFEDGKRAHDLGVKGTPTVFLNGREVPFTSLPPDKLRPLIQAEMNKYP